MPRPKKIISILRKGANVEKLLAEVTLEGITRRKLVTPLLNPRRAPTFLGFRRTTLAHEFASYGQLHRIQHLLLPEDYDLKIEGSQPPLYCLVYTPESMAQVPDSVLTPERLWAHHHSNIMNGCTWIKTIVLAGLVAAVPVAYLTRERLLARYHPAERELLLSLLISTGQAEGIHPANITATDIIRSNEFRSIVKSICTSRFEVQLDPADFAPHLAMLKQFWLIGDETPKARQWLAQVTRERLHSKRIPGP